jgi:hypothetical protein
LQYKSNISLLWAWIKKLFEQADLQTLQSSVTLKYIKYIPISKNHTLNIIKGKVINFRASTSVTAKYMFMQKMWQLKNHIISRFISISCCKDDELMTPFAVMLVQCITPMNTADRKWMGKTIMERWWQQSYQIGMAFACKGSGDFSCDQ